MRHILDRLSHLDWLILLEITLKDYVLPYVKEVFTSEGDKPATYGIEAVYKYCFNGTYEAHNAQWF